MPGITFLALKSPTEQDLGRMISRLADRDDAHVVLVEDAVYNAVEPERAERLKEVSADVLVAKDDLAAKGFAEGDLRTGRAVGYDEIVDLIMEATERTVTL